MLLTDDEKRFALSLLKHSVIHKLFDELEASRLNEAVTAKPVETDKINAALGEVRAVRSLRRSLELIRADDAST